MMTLQDVLDAVGATPERYGRGAWFMELDARMEPWCPLAVEVVGDLGYDNTMKVHIAADALGCPERDIQVFIDWWDAGGGELADVSRAFLESCGYRVPPDAVRDRARKRLHKEHTP